MANIVSRFIATLCIICAASGCSRPADPENSIGNAKVDSTQAEQPRTTASETSSPVLAQMDGKDKTDSKELEGVWLMVSGQQRGKKTPQDIVSESLLTIKNGDLSHTVLGVITLKGPFVFDPSTNPKSIVVTDADGPTNGKKLLGIYDLSGDELKLCFSLPDNERPKDFSASSDTGDFSTVWKRKKD